jgi:signal transduction histidine kinase
MNQTNPGEPQISRFRLLPLLIILVSLTILAGTIYPVSRQLRERIREQITGRDGELLNVVARMHQLEEDTNILRIEDPTNQLYLILKTSRVVDAFTTRLFDADGKFVRSFPDDSVRNAALTQEEIQRVKQLRPVSRFVASARLEDISQQEEPNSTPSPSFPVLAVTIPIRKHDEARLVGMAQFILDGSSAAEQFAALDKNLFRGALTAFLISGAVLLVTLSWAFWKLQGANRRLAQRTASLIKANHELALTAKTSAVGTLTSHLIHGLKNPLAGLHGFVSNRGLEATQPADPVWLEAAAATRRMQNLINQIVSVLSQEKSASSFELSLGELREILSAKLQPLAEEHGVELTTSQHGDGILESREANLSILILENLAQNAIQATSPGKLVKVLISADAENITCEVADQGPGLPRERREALFAPGHSTKPCGSGLGLAISQQLAKQINAQLVLKSTGEQGCIFALLLPKKLKLPANELASQSK